MSWKNILKSTGFIVWAKTEAMDGWKEMIRESGSREDAFKSVQKEAEKMPRTVIGSASEGKIVQIDNGIFENIMSEVIYYVIKPNGEPAPAPNYRPDTSQETTAEATVRRIRDKDFTTPEQYGREGQ